MPGYLMVIRSEMLLKRRTPMAGHSLRRSMYALGRRGVGLRRVRETVRCALVKVVLDCLVETDEHTMGPARAN